MFESVEPLQRPLLEPECIEKCSSSSGMLKLTQIRSGSGRKLAQRQTLVGLGLNKLNRVSLIKDSPETRGMINVVRHLIRVETE